MSKFEYRVVRVLPQKAETALNEAGEDGFELVDVSTASNKLVFTLMREKGPGRPKKKK